MSNSGNSRYLMHSFFFYYTMHELWQYYNDQISLFQAPGNSRYTISLLLCMNCIEYVKFCSPHCSDCTTLPYFIFRFSLQFSCNWWSTVATAGTPKHSFFLFFFCYYMKYDNITMIKYLYLAAAGILCIVLFSFFFYLSLCTNFMWL